MRDGTGNELISLEQNGSLATLKEANLYGSDRIGTFRPKAETDGAHTLANRSYDLKDHLGNIRATVTDERTKVGNVFEPTVVSASEYYPFGMESRTHTAAGADANRFGYNGKENDKTLGVQDYGFRLYKPELGRFLSQDPLRKKYPANSSYPFSENSPICSIDLEGLEKLHVFAKQISELNGTKINTVKQDVIVYRLTFVIEAVDGTTKTVALKSGTVIMYEAKSQQEGRGKQSMHVGDKVVNKAPNAFQDGKTYDIDVITYHGDKALDPSGNGISKHVVIHPEGASDWLVGCKSLTFEKQATLTQKSLKSGPSTDYSENKDVSRKVFTQLLDLMKKEAVQSADLTVDKKPETTPVPTNEDKPQTDTSTSGGN